jgi:hypothetical protein
MVYLEFETKGNKIKYIIADSLFIRFLTNVNVPYSIKFKLAVLKVHHFNLIYSIMSGNQDLTLVIVDFLIHPKLEHLIQEIKRPQYCMAYTYYENELIFEETAEGKLNATEEAYWEIKYKSKKEIYSYLDMLIEFEIMYMNENQDPSIQYYSDLTSVIYSTKPKKMRQFIETINKVKSSLSKPYSRLFIETDMFFQVEDILYLKPYHQKKLKPLPF